MISIGGDRPVSATYQNPYAVAILGLLVVSTLVARTSSAAFSATTDNTANSWSAGSVAISDDDAAAAMFAVTNLSPGVGSTECITVTYEGSIDATVKRYGAVTGGDGLDTYLDVTVRRGSGGSFGDCTGFSAVETVYTGTLAGLVAAHSDHASGAGTWAPAGGAPAAASPTSRQFDESTSTRAAALASKIHHQGHHDSHACHSAPCGDRIRRLVCRSLHRRHSKLR